ncbi:D-2-hydroxyacid dehydrogenase [Burkholderia sp. MR1-5-21]
MPRNYILTRAVGVFGQSMAEYVLSYMLAHERQHLERMDSQVRKVWDARRPGALVGKSVLIVGSGDIGTGVARFLKPFGVYLRGISRVLEPIEPFDSVHDISEFALLVSKSDYVINLLPDSTETRGIYNRELFQKFKPGSVFINSGRGSAVVEEDLVEALNEGLVAQAVIDVCQCEPLDQDSPLWSTPRLILTGHTAAPSAPAGVARLFENNLERLLDGEKLLGEVELG